MAEAWYWLFVGDFKKQNANQLLIAGKTGSPDCRESLFLLAVGNGSPYRFYPSTRDRG